MFANGLLTEAQRVSEELATKKALFALEQAMAKRDVLTKYTKAKSIKGLQAEVEKTRSDELARKSAWELEKSRETELERKVVDPKGSRAKPESE